MKKSIVLCADDFGQGEAVSRGILSLVAQGRLSAVSCLVTSPHFKKHADGLKPFIRDIDVGLHFNLTDGKSGLPSIILRALSGRLQAKVLDDTWEEQLAIFEETMGFTPHFIDGHHHVHQLKGVREALYRLYENRFKQTKPYIRVARGNGFQMMRSFKLSVMTLLGGYALQSCLKKKNIAYNPTHAALKQEQR